MSSSTWRETLERTAPLTDPTSDDDEEAPNGPLQASPMATLPSPLQSLSDFFGIFHNPSPSGIPRLDINSSGAQLLHSDQTSGTLAALEREVADAARARDEFGPSFGEYGMDLDYLADYYPREDAEGIQDEDEGEDEDEIECVEAEAPKAPGHPAASDPSSAARHPHTTPDPSSTAPNDPSSATSASSYLRVGSLFVGQQVFSSRAPRRPATGLQRRNSISRRPATANVADAPTVRAVATSVLDGLLLDNPHLASRRSDIIHSSYNAVEDPPTPTDTAIGGLGSRLQNEMRRTFEQRRGPQSSQGSGEGIRRTQARVDRLVSLANEQARTQQNDEWDVKVYITQATHNQVRGYMTAFGVPPPRSHPASLPSSPDHPGKALVTTYWVGDIIDPASPQLLWTSPSTSSVAEDQSNWSRLGPFVNHTGEAMAAGLRDPAWLVEQSRGWVFMRWKEVDFVNVERKSAMASGFCCTHILTPTHSSACESTLSIAGYYYMALDRKTGYLEGQPPLATL